MCIPLGGGMGSQILVRPNERATKLAGIFRFLLGAHLVYGILQMVSGSFFSGIISLVLVGIGYTTIKNSEGFSSMISCYSIFSGISLFYSIVTLIMASINGAPYDTYATWARQLLISISALSIPLFAAAVYVSKEIYNELRSAVNDLGAQAFVGQNGPGDGQSQQQAAAPSFPQPGSGNYNPFENPHNAAPSQPSGGFHAFSGKGHRLDGN